METGRLVALVTATAAVVSALVTAGFNYFSRDRELDIRLVEIGIGILSADPEKTGVFAARGWALDVVEANSGIDFSEQDRAQLLQRPLSFEYFSSYKPYFPSDDPKTPQTAEPLGAAAGDDTPTAD